MKELRKSLVAVLIITGLTLFYSCRKQEMPENLPEITKKIAIAGWLDDHKPALNSSTDKTTLDLINKNLDYSNITVGSRNNGDSIIIIPMNDAVKTRLELDTKSLLNLMIVQSKTRKFRWSTIVSFVPENGNAPSKLSDKTIQNILNNEPVVDNGMFKFFNLKGKLLYQIEYKNGKIHSAGTVVKGSQLAKRPNNYIPKTSLVDGGGSNCIDWYLAVTTYDEWGNVIGFYETYLFTTCEEGNGGGGSDPFPPEEPIDQEIVISGVDVEYETEFSEDDYAIDVEDENAIDMSLIPYAPAIRYDFPYDIRYPARMGIRFAVVTMGDVLVFPRNLRYYSKPKGWITREITPITTGKSASNSGNIYELTWNYSVYFRYAYSDYSSYTRTANKTHLKTVVGQM